MRALSLLALLILPAFAEGASAQSYGRGYGGPPPAYRFDDEYDRPRRRPRPDWDEEDRYGGPRRGPFSGRGGSSVCVTSRGSCAVGGFVPRNTPCGCQIPGFGFKRGATG